MRNNNSIKRDLLSRNIPPSSRQQILKNSKDKLVHSKKTFNKNNHAHYYSKSSNQANINSINKDKEISKKLSFNDFDVDDELDHPRPLMSENEEELDELKAHFKNDKSVNLDIYLKYEQNKELNLQNVPKSNEIPNINYYKIEDKIEIHDFDMKKNKIEKEDNKKKNIKFIPFQKNYKSETISRRQINQIKAQINNKMNCILNNNDILNNNNTEKKEKPKFEKIINSNKPSQEIYGHVSSNNLKEKRYEKINNVHQNNYQIRNENYNYMNISNQEESEIQYIIENQKQQVHSVYIPMRKIKLENSKKKNIQEESEKNYSHEKMIQTDPNIGYNLSKIIPKNKSQRVSKSINLSNINNLDSNEEIQKFESVRDCEINKLNINEIPIKNDKENTLNLIKRKSSEIKETDLQKRHNLFINKPENQKNSSKFRKKTFERGGKFNNVQTTYVVISKKPKTKGIPKAIITPEIIDYTKYKPINPTPSANCLNYSKLYKGMNNSHRYTTELKFQRMNLNEPQNFWNNKSLNNLPIKSYNIYNELELDKNNYEKNYMESFINESKDIYTEQKRKNSFYLINNTNQKIIPFFDYNYDYYYELNQMPNNSYISFNNNFNN